MVRSGSDQSLLLLITLDMSAVRQHNRSTAVSTKRNFKEQRGQTVCRDILFYLDYKRRSMLPYISVIEGIYRGPLYMNPEGRDVYQVITKCTLIALLCYLNPLCFHIIHFHENCKCICHLGNDRYYRYCNLNVKRITQQMR